MADCVGSKSLLCVPHDSHKRIRRLLSDPFSMPSLSTFVNKFDQMLCLKLKRVERVGESFNVLDFSMHMTFDAMCSMLMSVVEESVLREIEKDCIAVSEAMLSLPLMIPGTRYYKGIKARERLMGRFAGMIARRRNGVECHEDFLQSMLAKDSYPSSEKLEDSEIMDNLLTLIIAGQTTTAAAMMWSVKFLDENRGAQDRLRVSTQHSKQNRIVFVIDRSYQIICRISFWFFTGRTSGYRERQARRLCAYSGRYQQHVLWSEGKLLNEILEEGTLIPEILEMHPMRRS
ncbi:Ent-kaurenoic acid oxidase 1 [Linum perenne]